MSIIWLEDFNSISLSDLPAAGYTVLGTPTTSAGRFLASSKGFADTSTTSVIGLVLPAAMPTLTIGVANKALAFTTGQAQRLLCATTGTLGTGTTTDLEFRYVPGSGFTLVVGNVFVTGYTPYTRTANVWDYFELQVTPTQITGRINGTQVCLYNVAAQSYTKVGMGATRNSGAASTYGFYNDFYVRDDTVFQGDCQVFPRYPSSDVTKGLTPLTGTANYAMVGESLQDGDTSYVSSAVPSVADLYLSSAGIPGDPAVIHGVGVRMWARKDDATVRNVRARLKSGAAIVNGTTLALTTAYATMQNSWNTDPNTGAAWTSAAILASTFGPEVTP